MQTLESSHLLPTLASFPAIDVHPATAPWVNAKLPRPLPSWTFFLLLALLVTAPASTKVAGAAWLLVVLMGLWAALRLPVARSLGHSLVQSSRLWLLACLVALVLQAVPILYWSDPWGDRHVEIRLLLAAGSSFALMRRVRLLPQQKIWLTHALALACCVALAVTSVNGRMTPSNPIPWAAGVSFFVCVLMPLVLQTHISPWQRTAWGLAVLAGIAAVLLSLSRGSYGLALWGICVAGVVTTQQLLKFRRHKKSGKLGNQTARLWFTGIAVAFTLFTVLLISFPRNSQVMVGRVQEALTEIENINTPGLPQTHVINTAVGARLHMWRMALGKIAQAPLLGHGSKARIAWIHQLGVTDGSETIKSLSHLHSDSLTTLFDHGLFGLSSYLALGVGLAFLALRRKYCGITMRWILAGILWMHLTSGLTNMNFGHNYYGVMLALSLSLAWMLSSDETTEKQTPEIEEEVRQG